MIESIALVVGMVLGFLGGLTMNVRRTRWCARCGDTLTCPGCAPAPRKWWQV